MGHDGLNPTALDLNEHREAAPSTDSKLFPSAVKFHDFLTGLAGDREESPAGD
ncbi:unnamed protein product, partial [Ectocarpus fasciculatus]